MSLTLVSGKMWFSENADGAVELAADGSASITDKGEVKVAPVEQTTPESTSDEAASDASAGDAANSDASDTEGSETDKPAEEENKSESTMKWNGIHVDVEFTVTVASGVAEKTLLNR